MHPIIYFVVNGMNNTLKVFLGIAAIALAIGMSEVSATAMPGFGLMGFRTGMMGSGFGTGGTHGGMMGAGAMQNMMENAGFKNMMNETFNATGMQEMHALMHGNGTSFDMNAMHRAMHGKSPDVDMNLMHERMVSGNLTKEDITEMKEHCPMMQ